MPGKGNDKASKAVFEIHLQMQEDFECNLNMFPVFKRKNAIALLDAYRGNGLVKGITGIRRCGKSFLLLR